MTTLSARDEYSVAIAAGEKLTITSSVSSTGYVDRFRGSTNFGRTDITASQTLVFGPYLFGMRFNVVCQTGNISFTSSDENSAIDDIADVFRFGAVGDGVTDDTAAIQAAIAYAASLTNMQSAFVVVDLAGRSYGINSSGLSFDGISNVILKDCSLNAIGTWADTSAPVVNFTHTGTYQTIGGVGNGLINVNVNAGKKCAGVYFQNTFRNFMRDCYVANFLTYGVKSSTDLEGKNGDLQLHRVRSQALYQDDAGSVPAGTTGFHMQSADFVMAECKGNKCDYVSRFSELWNGQIQACHFFSGTGTTASCYIDSTAVHLGFSNCYFDTKPVILQGGFRHSFVGCHFWASADLHMVATEEDTTGAGLTIVGCDFGTDSTYFFLTEGVGTWVSQPTGLKKINWHGNVDQNGNPIYQAESWMGLGVMSTSGSIVLGHDQGVGSGASNIFSKIQIHEDAASASATIVRWENNSNGALIQGGKSRSTTIGTPGAAVQSGDNLLKIVGFGDDGVDIKNNGAEINIHASQTWDATKNGGEIRFSITQNDSTTLTEAVKIENTGDIDCLLGSYKVAGTKVIGAQETGWTAATGTPNKGAYATYAGQTMSAGYVQAEAQTLDDAVKAVSERLKALEDMNRTHGLMN